MNSRVDLYHTVFKTFMHVCVCYDMYTNPKSHNLLDIFV